MILKIFLLFLVLAASLAPMPGSAAPLFDDDGLIQAELRGPIGTLVDHKADDTEYPFSIVIDGAAIPLNVRTRGNSRRRVCDFPPLRFNFSSETTELGLFEGQSKLKLVTHCKDKSRDAENVLNEFLAYRIFNLISDSSYDVRLFRINYIDTTAPPDDSSVERFAFLLESSESLATRLGGEAAEVSSVAYSRLDHSQAALVYVFHYLVGNTDWSLVTAFTDEVCCHNGDLLQIDDKLVLVPYDFDLAGLVNASYAKPDRSLSIRGVRSRRYRGYCTSPEVLGDALREVKARRPAIMALASGTPTVSDKGMAQRLAYLEQFFEAAENEEKLLKEFERRCL